MENKNITKAIHKIASRSGMQRLCMVAVVIGGLAAVGATAKAETSGCVTDQLAGVCLPAEASMKASSPQASSEAMADASCDQLSGVCLPTEPRTMPSYGARVTVASADSECDQLSGVCYKEVSPKQSYAATDVTDDI